MEINKPQFDFSRINPIWLVVIIVILFVLLITCLSSHAQSFKREISVLDRSGRVKAFRKSVVHSGVETVTGQHGRVITREKLKPGEWLIVHEYGEYRGYEPTVSDTEALTVSAEGFAPGELIAIKRALESWNVGGIRFIYQEDGQVKIKRQSLTVMALSIMQIQDGRLVSADVLVDPHVTNLDALQSTVAHEFGHALGLSDTDNKSSVMYHKSRGRNRGNGHLGPTAGDLAAIR